MDKEGVSKYNELLIMYLNDFVNVINEKTDAKDRAITDAIEKLEKLLIEFNIVIDPKMIRQVIDNSFGMYSNILKTFFDNAGIHRINDNLNMGEIAKEMNEVTTNLSKAITESNKTPEYLDLIQKIKSTIIYIISQTNSTYTGHEYEVDQILNDAIGTFYSIYSDDLINNFLKDKLPELYKICDEINFANNRIVENNNNPNEDRDKFISETMDIEIHEGFKNGKVTLSITDPMGQRTELVGAPAIEKLKSYNQLYESSRPGRKADTSNWPEENHFNIQNNRTMEVDLSAPINDTMEMKPISNQNQQIDNSQVVEEQPKETDFNNLTTPRNENEEMIKNFLNQFRNDTLSTPNVKYEEEDSNDLSNLTVPVNNIEETTSPLNTDLLNNNLLDNSTDNYIENNNSFIPKYIEDTPEKVSFGDEFIGNYSNPNYDRDQFIKLTTGIEIQEDVDHRGKLFLRVIEPTGREVIYSGKEAVKMIQNYNQTYLDANPDKKVDTSLIDSFKE